MQARDILFAEAKAAAARSGGAWARRRQIDPARVTVWGAVAVATLVSWFAVASGVAAAL
jgi:hypothetical protein